MRNRLPWGKFEGFPTWQPMSGSDYANQEWLAKTLYADRDKDCSQSAKPEKRAVGKSCLNGDEGFPSPGFGGAVMAIGTF